MYANTYDQEAAPQPNEGKDLPATFGESFQDAWSNGQLSTSGIKQSNARDQATSEYVDKIKAAGGDVDGEYATQASALRDIGGEPDVFDVANTVAGKMKAAAITAGKDLPFQFMTSGDIDNRAVQISQAASAAHTGMAAREQGLSSRLGSFVGAAASQAADPYNIPMMALPVEGLGIMGTAAAFGLASAATQTANEAANASFNERVQPGYGASGEALGNIAEAGIGGAALGGGVKVLGNVFSRLATGAWPTASKDAANGIMSEAHTLNSNVLPGAEGEAAHQAAVGTSIDQVLKGDPVDVSTAIPNESDFAKRIGDLSGDYGTTEATPYERDTRRLDDRPNAETLTAFLKRNGGIQDSGGSLKAMDMVKGNPGLINKRGLDLDTARELAAEAGYLGPDTEAAMRDTDVNDLLDRLGEGKVYSSHDMGEVGRAGDAAQFNDFLDRRDTAVEEIQNHLADEGEEPLDPEHADAAAEHRMQGKSIPDAIEHSAADLYVRDAAHARRFREAPELPEIGYEAPKEIPQGYPGEPGARDYYAGLGGRERPGAEGDLGAAQEPLRGDSPTSEQGRPSLLSSDEIRAQVAAPDATNALRADIERAIDDAAKSGKALQVPIDIDANGEPVMGSVTSALSDVDRYNELADQIAACALPGAMQEAAE